MDNADKRNVVMATVSDMVTDFLYYDRREDEDLPVGEIEKMIRDGVVTEKEIVERFRRELSKGFRFPRD